MTPELAMRLTKALKVLDGRGALIEARQQWYVGEHPSVLGSKAWMDAYGRTYGRIIDNQIGRIVDIRAEAIAPQSFEVPETDNLADAALAQWATDLMNDYQQKFVDVATCAEWSGYQTTVAPDFDSKGNIVWYLLTPRDTYVEIDQAGEYLWGIHVWKDEFELTNATYYGPDFRIHLRSSAKNVLPKIQDFAIVDETPNPFGEVMLSTVDKGRSLVDQLWPINAQLNMSMQKQAVAGESYVLPLRIFLGIETYDEETGEVQAIIPSMDPSSGSRNVSIPTVADAEGDSRQIIQMASPDPSPFIKEQEQHRLTMAGLGSVPSFLIVAGGTPPSGDSLEILYLPHLAKKTSDERIYRPFLERLAELSVRMYLYKLTGSVRPAPQLRVQFSKLTTTTSQSRVEQFSTAVAAGMRLGDALVEFLGWNRDAADEAEAEYEGRQAAAAERSSQLFGAGIASD